MVWNDWKERVEEKPEKYEHLAEFGKKTKDVRILKDSEDYAGRLVEHTLTFEQFLQVLSDDNNWVPHDFVSWGFMLDSPGYYGFNDLVIGFTTEDDHNKYKEWLNSDGYIQYNNAGWWAWHKRYRRLNKSRRYPKDWCPFWSYL